MQQWIRRAAVPVLLVAGLLWGLLPPPAASGQAAQTETPTLAASVTTSATPTTGVPASASATLMVSSSVTVTASPSASGTPTGTGTPAISSTTTSAPTTTPTVVATPTFAVTLTPKGTASGTFATPVTQGPSESTSRNPGPITEPGLMRPRAVTTNLPTSFASITAGGSHTCALTAAGAAWCWGANGRGQLGDGTTLGSTVPVAVTGGVEFKVLSAGSRFTCGLTADGKGYCWGDGEHGQIGAGTTTSTSLPTAVSGGMKFSGITAGGGHTCGWTAAKVAYCWGANTYGQSGINGESQNPAQGQGADVTTPQRVQGDLFFSSLSAGGTHTCGVATTGSAFCWGSNQSGQLGTSTSTSSNPAPAQVGGSVTFSSVGAGSSHSCAISTFGRAYCWGDNNWGSLGDGSTVSKTFPGRVQGPVFTQIRVGWAHTCATRTDDTLWCWGNNGQGQVGNGTTSVTTVPVQVPGIDSATSFSTGEAHTCAISSGGRGYCWGFANAGQVGDGLDSVRPSPVKVSGTATFTSVTAGGWHTCGQTAAGATLCWGWNAKGQVGDGTTTNRSVPVAVSTNGTPGKYAKVSPGAYHTCSLDSSGATYCWGSGEFGGLGDGRFGTGTMASTPVAVIGGHVFTTIAAGHESACATDVSSGVWCWGKISSMSMSWQPDQANSVTAPQRSMTIGTGVVVASGYYTGRVRYCALSDGIASCVGLDTPGVAPTVSLASIIAGGNHFCGLTASNDAWCWGQNDYGQLGDGTTNSMSGLAQVSGGLKFSSLAAGGAFTCALTADGTAYCWGSNDYRQLGDGTSAFLKTIPTAVSTTLKFSKLSLGSEHACGIAKDGATYCWGNAYHGQVGDGTVGYRTAPTLVMGQTAPTPIPTPVSLPNRLSSLAAGGDHTCGLTPKGEAYCWGANTSGELGDGTSTNRATPVAVTGGRTFKQLVAGSMHTCGLTSAGDAYCWGYNAYGQVGNGTAGGGDGQGNGSHAADQPSPVRVTGSKTFSTLVANGYNTCGLTSSGVAYCWGNNYFGQIGDGTGGNGFTDDSGNRSAPTLVGGGLTFASLATGFTHTCGRTASGKAYCWGDNVFGQLGDGTSGNSRVSPVAVSSNLSFASLVANYKNTCGLTASGHAYCWGQNNFGQIGDGTGGLGYSDHSADQLVPVAVTGGQTFTSIEAGMTYACGVTPASLGYCWGNNWSGQLGDGTVTSHVAPVAVAGRKPFTTLVAGWNHTCGLTIDGIAYCWGYNDYGQLGDGTTGVDRFVPTAVDVSAIPVPATIRAIRVANVRDTSFTVSWVTDVASTGTVSWRPGTSTASPTFAVDVRGADTSSTVHQVTVTGLAASTRYLFDVTSGTTTETNGGTHFAVTTGPILSIPATDSVYGTVVRKDGTTPSAVTVQLTASGSAGTSAPLATLVRTNDAKTWILGLGNLRTADASAAFTYTDATILKVQADGGADGTAVGTVTVADARIGKLALTLSDEIATPLQSGWNLVALQVTPASPVTAMALCASLDATVAGSAYEIDRWENSGWDGHRCGVPANNFTLEPGRGYFIRVTKPVTWSLGGTRIITPPSLSLGTGWNLIGVGAVAPGTVTAPSGCTAMDGTAGTGTVVELDRWEAGAWEGHRCGLPVNAFPLQAGRGYFVRLTRPAIWAPAGGAP